MKKYQIVEIAPGEFVVEYKKKPYWFSSWIRMATQIPITAGSRFYREEPLIFTTLSHAEVMVNELRAAEQAMIKVQAEVKLYPRVVKTY